MSIRISSASRTRSGWRATKMPRQRREGSSPYELAEHALEDRVDVLGVVAHVEQRHELVVRQELPDLLVGAAQRQERGIAAPRLHGIALDGGVGVLATHALLGQRQQHALREDQPTQ